MSEVKARFSVLREAAKPDAVAALERLIKEGSDRALNRINVYDFAAANSLPDRDAISAFLHASRLGLFDMSWHLLCPGCGGVLDANTTLKTITREEYGCSLCAATYRPTLDEMVEVSFTVNPRVRRIGAHHPDTLPFNEYVRQMYWSCGVVLPEGDAYEAALQDSMLDSVELPPGEKVILSLQLPPQFVVVFEPVTHAATYIDVQGEPTRERQELGIVYSNSGVSGGATRMRPGPLRLTLENRTGVRVLPAAIVKSDSLGAVIGTRKRVLTAKHLLTNQTFREIYRTDALDIDQRLHITSLTFLFTDLKGSTALYERVGDLVAYDLVKAHFGALNEVVAAESGAVVKTIGDAVMASFATPDRGVAAALRMREAMHAINAQRDSEDLTLKIGIHEGPCLAVMLNDRLDYFGQTVNIAARVQGLAESRSIFATESVVRDSAAAKLIADAGVTPLAQERTLRGISETHTVYEIP